MNGHSFSHQKDAAIRRILRRALAKHGGNKTHAAWELRIDRSYINRLVKKYGLGA